MQSGLLSRIPAAGHSAALEPRGGPGRMCEPRRTHRTESSSREWPVGSLFPSCTLLGPARLRRHFLGVY